MIVHTHTDVPIRVMMTGDDVTQATSGGAFDYPRARAGGLDVAFMSIFIPASVDDVVAHIDRGYSDTQIKLVLGENLLRVWSAVEQVAHARGGHVQCAIHRRRALCRSVAARLMHRGLATNDQFDSLTNT